VKSMPRLFETWTAATACPQFLKPRKRADGRSLGQVQQRMQRFSSFGFFT
jgi:hypothetical protein